MEPAAPDPAAETRKAIEAIVLVADHPVEPSLLAQLLEVPKAAIEEACTALAAEYVTQNRGFVLARVAGGYRFQTDPSTAPYVERFVLSGQNARLSAAALETLAIVAYKQPISRLQIAAIRGVSVDGVIRTLEQRGYIAEVGRDPGPGNATLFGTTPEFLERLGIDSLDDLPPLAAFVPDADVVEALEQGLRPDVPEMPPAPPAAKPADPAGSDVASSEHPSDEVTPQEPSDVAAPVTPEPADVAAGAEEAQDTPPPPPAAEDRVEGADVPTAPDVLEAATDGEAEDTEPSEASDEVAAADEPVFEGLDDDEAVAVDDDLVIDLREQPEPAVAAPPPPVTAPPAAATPPAPVTSASGFTAATPPPTRTETVVDQGVKPLSPGIVVTRPVPAEPPFRTTPGPQGAGDDDHRSTTTDGTTAVHRAASETASAGRDPAGGAAAAPTSRLSESDDALDA